MRVQVIQDKYKIYDSNWFNLKHALHILQDCFPLPLSDLKFVLFGACTLFSETTQQQSERK